MKNTLIRNTVKYVRSAAILIAAIVIAVPASGQDIPDADGLFTKKYISSFDYDTMEGVLTLETFVTGEMKLVTEPFDVVMVLDKSGSMAGDPIANMKVAACSVVDQIKTINGADGQSKLGVITFDNNSNTICDLGVVNETSVESFKSAINKISTGGATYMSKGLETAYKMLKNIDSGRKKFIVFFTDGKPGTDAYDDNAISETRYVFNNTQGSACMIKSAGIEIFSIGLFADDPSTKYVNTSTTKPTGTGNVSIKSYLEHISSLYQGVTGLKSSGSSPNYKLTWQGDDTPVSQDPGYYRWAQTPEDLNNIFKEIITAIIGVASKSLTAETVIKDIISADCTLPDGVKVEDVKVYSATCTGGNKTDGYTFGNRSDETADVEIIVAENTVNVTNFNFGANWVGYNASTGKYQGKKLIVEIPLKVLPGALAGKDIKQLKTNGEKSGVYENGDSDDPIKPYPVPEIDYIDVIIKATGLHADESALFKVERKMAGEDGFSYFTTIALTGTSDEGTEISSKILYQDPDATYKVTDLTGWSWTYTKGATSQTKTIEDGDPIVFEFSNTKKENITIQNAEKSKDNRFSTYTSDGMTVTGNWFGNEKKL